MFCIGAKIRVCNTSQSRVWREVESTLPLVPTSQWLRNSKLAHAKLDFKEDIVIYDGAKSSNHTYIKKQITSCLHL